MGHVRRRDDRWEARWRLPNGRERSRRFDRKVDARRFLDQQAASQVEGLWSDPVNGRTTLDAWWQQWWPTVHNLRPSSRARDESYYRNHIAPKWGTRQLASISHHEVSQWVGELVDKGLAPGSVGKVFQTLSKAMKAAVRARLISQHPCHDVPLPRVPRREMRFLDVAELQSLASAMDPRFESLVLTMGYCGLRVGEAVALEWDSVDLNRQMLQVTRSLAEVRGEVVLGEPKTAAGRRSVPMPGLLVERLGQIERSEGRLWTAPEGGPIRVPSWRQRFWQPAVRSAGCHPLRIHDLRHTAVSLWINAGANVKAVATWAGHTSVATVIDRYGHLMDPGGVEVFGQLDEMARGVIEGRAFS